MRHYKTSKRILEASLADVKAGRWKRERFAVIPKRALNGLRVKSGEIEIVEACEVQMGCALGLVNMHGGHGRPLKRGFFEPYYASHKRGHKGVVEATLALYEAMPTDWKFDNDDRIVIGRLDTNALTLQDVETRITEFNDESHTDKRKAIRWFERALRLQAEAKR